MTKPINQENSQAHLNQHYNYKPEQHNFNLNQRQETVPESDNISSPQTRLDYTTTKKYASTNQKSSERSKILGVNSSSQSPPQFYRDPIDSQRILENLNQDFTKKRENIKPTYSTTSRNLDNRVNPAEQQGNYELTFAKNRDFYNTANTENPRYDLESNQPLRVLIDPTHGRQHYNNFEKSRERIRRLEAENLEIDKYPVISPTNQELSRNFWSNNSQRVKDQNDMLPSSQFNEQQPGNNHQKVI